MATTTVRNGFQGGTDDQLKVNPDGSINIGSGGGSNASVGPTGDPAPSSATLAGGIDDNGLLQPLHVNADGELLVAATPTGFSIISPGYPMQVNLGTTSAILVASNPLRKYAHIFNNSTEAIFIQFQSSAALNQGIKVGPGSFFTLDTINLWLGDVNGIGLMAGQLISVLEGE